MITIARMLFIRQLSSHILHPSFMNRVGAIINGGEAVEGLMDARLQDKVSHLVLGLFISLAQDISCKSSSLKVKGVCSLFIGGFSLFKNTYLTGSKNISWVSLVG
ncbi:MAG: hypothetical protein ACRDFB_09215, partial [Rhabdochlamydiaceae bacterium]